MKKVYYFCAKYIIDKAKIPSTPCIFRKHEETWIPIINISVVSFMKSACPEQTSVELDISIQMKNAPLALSPSSIVVY